MMGVDGTAGTKKNFRGFLESRNAKVIGERNHSEFIHL
jgi:hypothetical protein